MPDKFTKVVDLELHPSAQSLLKQRITDYAETVLLQAKLLASQERDGVVTVNHIQDALKLVTSEGKRTWAKELALIIGSGAFGAFIQGLPQELDTGNIRLIVLYIVMGFLGTVVVYWGLWQREKR